MESTLALLKATKKLCRVYACKICRRNTVGIKIQCENCSDYFCKECLQFGTLGTASCPGCKLQLHEQHDRSKDAERINTRLSGISFEVVSDEIDRVVGMEHFMRVASPVFKDQKLFFVDGIYQRRIWINGNTITIQFDVKDGDVLEVKLFYEDCDEDNPIGFFLLEINNYEMEAEVFYFQKNSEIYRLPGPNLKPSDFISVTYMVGLASSEDVRKVDKGDDDRGDDDRGDDDDDDDDDDDAARTSEETNVIIQNLPDAESSEATGEAIDTGKNQPEAESKPVQRNDKGAHAMSRKAFNDFTPNFARPVFPDQSPGVAIPDLHMPPMITVPGRTVMRRYLHSKEPEMMQHQLPHKVIQVLLQQNVQLHISENAWKPVHKKAFNESGWVSRHEDNKPKMIGQIHKEAEQEEQQKHVLLQRASQEQRTSCHRPRTPNLSGSGSVSEDGWRGALNNVVDPSRMKLTKHPVEDMQLGLGVRPGYSTWLHGCSGADGSRTSSLEREKPQRHGTNDGYHYRNHSRTMSRGKSFAMRLMRKNSNAAIAAVRAAGNVGDYHFTPTNLRNASCDPSCNRERSSNSHGSCEFVRSSSYDPSRVPIILSRHSKDLNRIGSELNIDSHEPNRVAIRSSDGGGGPRAGDGGGQTPLQEMSLKDIENKSKSILEEYLHVCDLEEASFCMGELRSPKAVTFFVTEAINFALERSHEEWKHLGRLLAHLVKMIRCTLDHLMSSFRKVLNYAEDMEVDIPKIWQYLGELMATSWTDGSVPLRLLKKFCEPLASLEKTSIVGEIIFAITATLSYRKLNVAEALVTVRFNDRYIIIRQEEYRAQLPRYKKQLSAPSPAAAVFRSSSLPPLPRPLQIPMGGSIPMGGHPQMNMGGPGMRPHTSGLVMNSRTMPVKASRKKKFDSRKKLHEYQPLPVDVDYDDYEHAPVFFGPLHKRIAIDAKEDEDFDASISHPACIGFAFVERPQNQPPLEQRTPPGRRRCSPREYVFPLLLTALEELLRHAKTERCFEENSLDVDVKMLTRGGCFADIDAFEQLLGPCIDVMIRNIDSYEIQV